MRLFSMIMLALVASAGAQDAEREAPFMGVGVAQISDEIRAGLRIPKDVEGLLVIQIVQPSAAQRAGFRPGDVITHFDGKEVRSREALVELITAKKLGAKVSYRLRRGTGTIEGTLTLGKRPPEGESSIVALPGIGEAADAPPDAPEMPPEPKRAPAAEPRPEKRIDQLQAELQELRRRMEKTLAAAQEAREKEAKGKPRTLAGWIEREERLLKAARDERTAQYHSARMSVLKEMREADAQLPVQRLDRVEKLLQEIFALLKRR